MRSRAALLPVIMDPIYGYQVVNVEAQLSDQSSLLQWTRNMIALRKLFQVFGRGTLEFLHPENRKILSYLRDLEREDGTHETVLCVANLSRFAQPVALDLKQFAGAVPVEMLGYVQFPAITTASYVLTVAPYSFLWFELQPAPATSESLMPEDHFPAAVREETEQVALDLLTKGWAGFFSGHGKHLLEAALPAWLPRQRWFGAKTRTIQTLSISQWTPLPAAAAPLLATAAVPTANTLGDLLVFVDLTYAARRRRTRIAIFCRSPSPPGRRLRSCARVPPAASSPRSAHPPAPPCCMTPAIARNFASRCCT